MAVGSAIASQTPVDIPPPVAPPASDATSTTPSLIRNASRGLVGGFGGVDLLQAKAAQLAPGKAPTHNMLFCYG